MLSMRREKKSSEYTQGTHTHARYTHSHTHTELEIGNRNEGEILAKFKHPQPFGFCKMGRQKETERVEWLKKIVHTQRAPRVSNTTNSSQHPNGQPDRPNDRQTEWQTDRTTVEANKSCLMRLQCWQYYALSARLEIFCSSASVSALNDRIICQQTSLENGLRRKVFIRRPNMLGKSLNIIIILSNWSTVKELPSHSLSRPMQHYEI